MGKGVFQALLPSEGCGQFQQEVPALVLCPYTVPLAQMRLPTVLVLDPFPVKKRMIYCWCYEIECCKAQINLRNLVIDFMVYLVPVKEKQKTTEALIILKGSAVK